MKRFVLSCSLLFLVGCAAVPPDTGPSPIGGLPKPNVKKKTKLPIPSTANSGIVVIGKHLRGEQKPVAGTQPSPTPSPSPERVVHLPTPIASPVPRVKPTPRAAFVPPKPELVPETRDYKAVDRHALAASARDEASVESLAAYLSRGARSDREKARAIYRWITDRIAYDGEALRSGKLPDPDPEITLKTRRGVCSGYAELYAALARRMGLTVEVISGHAKGLNAGRRNSESNGHAWNAVLLDGKWELLDSTWGAGNTDQNFQFKKEFDDAYFCVPPPVLLASHLPETPKWQLRARPISEAEFWASPKLRPEFFSQGLTVLDGTHDPLPLNGTARIQLDVPESVGVRAELRSPTGSLENYTFVTRRGRVCTVEMAAPAAGPYLLVLYTGAPGASTFHSCAEWNVEARGAAAGPFPKTYIGYESRHIELTTPRSGVLAARRKHRFQLDVDGAEEVMVQNGEDQLDLLPVGHSFQGEYTLEPGTATVFARFPGESRYVGLAEYQVK